MLLNKLYPKIKLAFRYQTLNATSRETLDGDCSEIIQNRKRFFPIFMHTFCYVRFTPIWDFKEGFFPLQNEFHLLVLMHTFIRGLLPLAKMQGTWVCTFEAEQITCSTVKLPPFLKCFLSSFLYVTAQAH